jgi:very-short-patch-repair endonuclease
MHRKFEVKCPTPGGDINGGKLIFKDMIRQVTDRELRFGRMLYERRSEMEKKAFQLLPISMQKNVVSNYPVAFIEHASAYYPDFLLWKEKMIIEIDGQKHLDQVEHDSTRDEIFENNGFAVIRIPARIVNNPFDFWFMLFCGFAKIERTGYRASLSKYVNDLNSMVERLALTLKELLISDK